MCLAVGDNNTISKQSSKSAVIGEHSQIGGKGFKWFYPDVDIVVEKNANDVHYYYPGHPLHFYGNLKTGDCRLEIDESSSLQFNGIVVGDKFTTVKTGPRNVFDVISVSSKTIEFKMSFKILNGLLIGLDDYYFVVVGKPEIGFDDVEGNNSFSVGIFNTNRYSETFSSGMLNEPLGAYSMCVGKNNKSQWGCAALGADNNVFGMTSFAEGRLNTVAARGAHAENAVNDVYANWANANGIYTLIPKDDTGAYVWNGS